MKKIFKKYAKYLRENHLEELVKRNLEISKTMDIPIMRLFKHLTDEQLLEQGKPSMEGILCSIEDDTFWEKAEETYTQWKEDKLKDISKHDIHPSDIVLINAIRKKGFMSFIPSFSYDIDEISELMNDMDDFFRECDRTGMEVFYFIQKETEKKYKDSEERYRDLFESANDLIHIADINGKILYANKSWLITVGYSINDLQKLSIKDIIHPDYLDKYLDERKKIMDGNPPDEFEFAIISSSGKKTYLEGSISCQFKDGVAYRTRGIFTNITTKKNNEEKLKIYTKNLIESEERYRLFLENVKDYAIFLINPEGLIMSWNAGAEQIIGYSTKEIIGCHISVFYPLDVLKNQEPEYHLKMAKDFGRYESESYRVKKDETKFLAHVVLTALYDTDGTLKGFVKIIRDITEQKQIETNLITSQNKLKAIFDYAPDAIIVADLNLNITGWNKSAEKIYGFTFEEAIGKNGIELLSAEFTEPYTLETALAEMQEKGSWTGEVITTNNKGEKITIISSITTLYDKAGNPSEILSVNKDISERKKADGKIARTLKLLSEAEQMAHIGSWEINVNTSEIIWSDELYRIYELEPTETESLWKIFFKYIHPDDRENLVKCAEEAIQLRQPTSVNYRIITSKGEIRSLIANCNVIFDDAESELKLTGTIQDITERKEKDDKIIKTLQRLNEAQRMAHIGSWEMDLKTNILNWSDEMYRIYGLEPFEEDPIKDVFRKYNHPEDTEKIWSIINKSLEDQKPYTFEYRITDAKGIQRTLLTHGSIISNDEGVAIKMSGTVQDISERKITEEKIDKTLQQLNEAQQMAHIGSWEWDIGSNTIEWSDELYKIYGFKPKEIIPNYENFLNYIHPDDREMVDGIIMKALEDKKSFYFDHRVLRKDGSIRILNARGIVTTNNLGEPIKMSGTGQDITERVLSSEELKRAEDAVKAKQQFLSNMSHEIRTPLNSIIGFTKVVLKSDLTNKQREYLDAIKLSGQTLLVLINDILDLAKVDAGQMVFEKIPFKLSSSVSAMLHLFDTKVQEKNISLINEYDQNIPEVLVGDPVRLHQIILNLVSNAIKFTNKGKITMKTTLVGEENEFAKIEFSITDTGIGIHEDKLETIFENFQQGSSSTGRLYGGTGLGLAIVKQLVTHQGGTISVISQVNKGTTFTFQLSFKKAEVGQLVEVDDELYFNEEFSLKNIKVLVVEDVLLNQLLMKAILDEFGYEYDIEENGRTAIEKLKTDKYDIVLMDLQMPEMNGFEATEYIRKQLLYPVCNIPIIALTADVTTVDLDKCIAVGMNDYVTKPIDEKLLLNKINKLLKQPFKVEEELQEMKEDRSNIKEKCINLEYLKNKVKGNSALMKQMIEVYLEQTPNLIKKMRESLENKDWETLHKAAHRIIPSFAMVGIDPEFEIMAKKIFEFAILQEQYDEIHEMFLKIEEVCMQACHELETEYFMFQNNKID